MDTVRGALGRETHSSGGIQELPGGKGLRSDSAEVKSIRRLQARIAVSRRPRIEPAQLFLNIASVFSGGSRGRGVPSGSAGNFLRCRTSHDRPARPLPDDGVISTPLVPSVRRNQGAFYCSPHAIAIVCSCVDTLQLATTISTVCKKARSSFMVSLENFLFLSRCPKSSRRARSGEAPLILFLE